MNNTLFVIIGATCSKKSSLATHLNNTFGYDIVNSDIYKAYKVSDMWVNQIEEEKICNCKYHLYSFLDPFKAMNVALYQEIGRKKIEESLEKNCTILVGGSCLYMNAVLFNEYNFNRVGKQKRPDKFTNYFSKVIYIGLNWDRVELYENISKRVDKFVKTNLDTPKVIYEKYRETLLGRAIGYKEWFGYFENKVTKDQAIELIKKNTRNYAKRQLTWYRQQYQDITWFDITNDNIPEVFEKIASFVKDEADCEDK